MPITKDTNAYFNFLYSQGKYRKITQPPSGDPVVYGMSGSGSFVSGTYTLKQTMVGFLISRGEVQTLEFPASTATAATGVNDSGQVAGAFIDSDEVQHGFTWTPPAPVAKKRPR